MSGPESQAQPGPTKVQCVKLGRELPALAAPPFPNELGRRIQAQVSREAWDLWLEQSKMLINEYRLNLRTPEARKFLMEQCEAFFFGPGSAPPAEFEPPQQP
jgi:Fe-S cluster biosynthesis and repair protein YggX